MKKMFLFIATLSFAVHCNAQQISTMISSGSDIATCCAISPNNKYVAKMNKSKASIWDFKTGRLVREIQFETTDLSNNVRENVPDSISFSADDNSVFIYRGRALFPNKGSYKFPTITEISIETGVAGKQEVNLKPVRNYDSLYQQRMIKMGISVNDTLKYSSPNGKYQLVYHNGGEYGRNTRIRKNGVLSEILGHPIYMYHAFSSDSRYLFTNDSIYDFMLDKKVCQLKSTSVPSFDCGFINNSNRFYTTASQEIIVWDFPKINYIKTQGMSITSSNGGYLTYTNPFLKQHCIMNLVTKEVVTPPIKYNAEEYEYVSDVSDDGKYLLTMSMKAKKIYNCVTGELVRLLPEFNLGAKYLFLNNTEVVSLNETDKKGEVTKYNFLTDKNEKIDLNGMIPFRKNESILSMAKLKNDHLIVSTFVYKKDFNVYVINLQTKDVDKLTTTPEFILTEKSKMSKDNNLVALNMVGSKIFVFNKRTKTKLELDQFFNVLNFAFSSDSKHLIVLLVNGKSKYWDLETGKEIASVISTGYQEYVITTPEQYYISTKGATEYVHFVKGNKLYGIEQFDLKYNRPDIVLKKMDLGNEKVIEAYHKAYLKRLKKMKLTEEMLSDELNLPEVKITNAEQISPSLDVDELKLNLSIADKKYKLHRINIWINDVALYGANGISLKSMNALNYETSIALKLKKGINKIQVSALNVAGAESYKETITVNCTKGKEKPDLYLICIGAGEFTHAEYNLNYAAKDAKDVSEVFKTNKNYGSVFTKTITNKEVTRSNVIKLKELLKTADRNDEVILFYAGHGVLDKNLDYYLSTGDMDFNNPSANGITYETLESILDSIAPLKKVLLIDACHSGEIDKEEVVVSSSQKINSGIKFRNVGSTIEQKESYLGLENTSELSKALFTDLRRGTGATVISSAGGKEYAMESDAWKNGLFTYCLIHGLKDLAADTNKDGKIVLSELQQYLREEVTNLSNGAQKPTSRIENLSMDFKIW